LHPPTIARVAPCDLDLGGVQRCNEAVPIPDRRKPPIWLDRLREETDVFSREPVDVEVFDDGRRVERTCSQAVVDDVVPHLEGEDPSHECLVEDALAKPIRVRARRLIQILVDKGSIVAPSA